MSNLLCLKCGTFLGLLTDVDSHNCGCGNRSEFLKVPDQYTLQEKTRKIFFLVGPTGSGKNFVTTRLKELNFENVPSVTTRGPRAGEVAGEDYVYISKEEMNNLKANNLLCEYIKYGSSEYGVSREILLEKLWLGDKNLIIIVEPKGYEQMLIWFSRNHKLIRELPLELSTIFLNVDRLTRFMNLVEDAGFTGAYNNFPNKETFHLDVVLTEASDREKFSKILDRLVRNGDSIAEVFMESMDLFRSLFRDLDDIKLPMNKIELTTRDEVSEFIYNLENASNPNNQCTMLEMLLSNDISMLKDFHQKLYHKIKVLEGKS